MSVWKSRRRRGSKDVTSDYRTIDVRLMQRENLLAPGRSFVWSWTYSGEKLASIQVRTESDSILLHYRHKCGSRDWRHLECRVRLDWTGCSLGGRRAWMLCPSPDCARRVALLYIGDRGAVACRHCYKLAYASQRETVEDRAARRADKIRRRFGWEPGIFAGEGKKPKGMHWRTFNRMQEAYEHCKNVSLRGMVRRLARLGVDLPNKAVDG
jgi:hypothetical protein